MHRRAHLAWWACCALLLASWLVLPLLPEPRGWDAYRAHAYGSAACYFLVLGGAVLGGVALLDGVRGRGLAAAVAATFAVAMLCNLLDVAVASDAAKVAFGTAVGAATLRAIERPWWLAAIAVAVPVADAWSVLSERGVTHAVLDRAAQEPRWIDWPTIATPVAGIPLDDVGRLGVVDVAFLALFLAGARRWRLGARRLAVVLPLSFAATTVVATEWLERALPALPLLCLAFLVLAAPGLWRDARSATARVR